MELLLAGSPPPSSKAVIRPKPVAELSSVDRNCHKARGLMIAIAWRHRAAPVCICSLALLLWLTYTAMATTVRQAARRS
jgi:hypothetical protein